MSSFDQVTQWTEHAPGRFAGHVTEDWLQGRTAFGGLLVTGCVRLGLASVDQPLRTVDARFFEPVLAGELEARVEVLRTGRSVSHVQVEVWQGERRCMRTVLCTATPRPSELVVPTQAPQEDLGSPDDLMELPYLPGLTPAFTQHVDMRFHRGIPFTGSERAEIDGWCRFRAEATGMASVVGLVDAWPAPLLTMGRGVFPASTVHWTLHWFGGADLDPMAWYRYRSRALQADHGNTTFEAHLWDEHGRLVAWSEQLAVVFDVRSR